MSIVPVKIQKCGGGLIVSAPHSSKEQEGSDMHPYENDCWVLEQQMAEACICVDYVCMYQCNAKRRSVPRTAKQNEYRLDILVRDQFLAGNLHTPNGPCAGGAQVLRLRAPTSLCLLFLDGYRNVPGQNRLAYYIIEVRLCSVTSPEKNDFLSISRSMIFWDIACVCYRVTYPII